MIRRGGRRILGAVVSMGAMVTASQFVAPGTQPVRAAFAAPACGAAPAGTARCLGLFLQLGAHRSTAPGLGPAGGLAPAEIHSAYDLPISGAHGRTVAIVDAYDDPDAEADMNVYRAAFRIAPCTAAAGCFHRVDQRGGTAYPAPDAGWSQEIALDLEMVSATCPDCHILLVEADSAGMPDLGQAENTAAAHPGVVAVSNSFGSAEDPAELSWDARYFTHPGVALVAASGDSGYGAIYPASSPLVTAVGGTSLVRSGGPRGWTETGWGESGSGCSAYEPRPTWQSATSCSLRSVADVAAVADPGTGVAVYDSFQSQGWTVAGGTSAAAPIVASVYALAGNTAQLAGAGRAYAAATALTDVSQGPSNTLLCLFGNSCRPGPGYDGPTGLGSPWGLSAF